MGKICVFFGHRQILHPKQVEAELKRVVENLIIEGVDTFWLGGYGEFDHLAAKVTHNLKFTFPHIQRLLVLAYLPTNREDYQFKKRFYDLIFCPEGVELGHKKFAIIRRNKYMVEKADVVVAFVKTDVGGASRALKYAKKLKKKIILLK